MSGLFRLGEMIGWEQVEFPAHEPITGATFRFGDAQTDQAREVHAIHWEIFAENRADLEPLLWEGDLEWRWLNGGTAIGPLSFFSGSFMDLFMRDTGKSGLQQLAGSLDEREWKQLAQTMLLGQNLFFRGLMRYDRHPVLLPAHTSQADIVLGLRKPVLPAGLVRVRVILKGVFQRAINVS